MTDSKSSKLRRFVRDVSVNAVGGLVILIILALISWIKPFNSSAVRLYVWQLFSVLFIVFVAGYLIACIRFRSYSKKGEVEFASGAYARNSAPFQTTALQDHIIRILRKEDGDWISLQQLVEDLSVTSRQDLYQAVAQLENEGWLDGHRDNYIVKEYAKKYRLKGDGLTYAQQQGFETKIEMERRRLPTF